MRKVFILIAAGLILAGCIQTETRVKVKKDGSGTIEKTVLMRADVVEMLASMQAFDTAKKEKGILDEIQLKADASKLGEGVRYKNAVPLKTSVGEGYTVVYTFPDINKIRISQTPGDEIPAADLGGGEKSGSGEFLTFHLKKGGTADLQVLLYQLDESAAEPDLEADMDSEGDEEDNDAEQMDPAMLEQFYRDMKFSIFIEVEGSIVETNADHRSGSTVSLVHVDFNTLMKQQDALRDLNENNVKTLEDMKEFTKKYQGIELETKDEIRIRFR